MASIGAHGAPYRVSFPRLPAAARVGPLTLECFNRQPLLARPRLKQLPLNAIHEMKKQFGLHVGGYVILDDHAHLVFVTAAGSEYLGPMTYLRASFARAYDYHWSSLHARVDQGIYTEDWAVLGPPASLGRFAPHG